MPTPTCVKCGGFLTMHPMDDTSHVIMAARCVNCGKIVDPVINAYQAAQAQGLRRLTVKQQRYARGKYR